MTGRISTTSLKSAFFFLLHPQGKREPRGREIERNFKEEIQKTSFSLFSLLNFCVFLKFYGNEIIKPPFIIIETHLVIFPTL
jgi:hypothetical protein